MNLRSMGLLATANISGASGSPRIPSIANYCEAFRGLVFTSIGVPFLWRGSPPGGWIASIS